MVSTRKKIFITGVAGFLGSHLAKSLINDGHIVSGIDNLLGGYKDNIPDACSFKQADCNNINQYSELLNGADIVYHCAATAYEGLSVFSPHIIAQNVLTSTTGIVSASIANKVKRFILCSSMARYGQNKVPFTEDMVPVPQDPYGICKYASELILQNLANTHNMEWVIAVPHNIIGPHQKYDDPFRNVASIFINMMLQNRQPFIYGDGNQRRCFSFIEDVISPLKMMGFSPECNKQIINIGPDDEFITINDLAKIIADLIGFKLEPSRITGRPQEVYLANCSANKARSILGYKPSVKLQDGLTQMINWIRQRGTKPFQYHINLEIINDKTPITWNKKLF